MRMQPEAKFKHKLVTSFEKHVPGGWYTYIVKGPGMKDGLPDLLFGQPGVDLLWVEAKWKRRKASASQEIMRDRLIRSGERVILIKPATPYMVLWGDGNYDSSAALDLDFWPRFFKVSA